MKQEFEVTIKGTAPLLQNRFNPENAKGSKKKGSVYDDNEFVQNALYLDAKGRIVQPVMHLEAALIKAAVNFKFEGKLTFKDLFKAGIFIEPFMIPHRYQDFEVDLRSVVVNRARIMRARPMIPKWELTFKIQCIEERITPAILKEILTEAGTFYGIGDNRPRNVRFEIVHFKEVKGRAPSKKKA